MLSITNQDNTRRISCPSIDVIDIFGQFTDGEDVVLHVAVSHDLDPQVASYRPGGAGHVHNLGVNPRANKLSACNWELLVRLSHRYVYIAGSFSYIEKFMLKL